MLQYPVQLPPLLQHTNNDLTRKRLHKHSASFSKPRPLDIASPFLQDPPSPSPASAKFPRSPYISSRQLPTASPKPFSNRPLSVAPSVASLSIEDVLAPGDVVGNGFYLQGELISEVSSGVSADQPAQEFEVIKKLGTGSYAVVYLVQEVLSRPAVSEDGHMSTIGLMEFDNKPAQVVYGRKYAIKCLSKANLDEEALAVQMSEVTIHQSLHLHPNIVTLHRTLETSAFLLLLLEYVPGEDLFYFLEQSRDHYELDISQPTDSSVSTLHTPPTPSLLSNLHPSHLLSRTRLRLIASMFSQMCDAVAACHAQQVFHRDIKPENFIVTDGFTDGRSERKVIVKLTDFGLSTTDLESADMDCGSAPYMSYECRNNVAPTYRPRGADVWSLGIVLINMLYHFNPWTDTAEGGCSSFAIFLKDPVNFFMQRFMGMTRPVAETLANKVFCILEDPQDDSPRMTASEFGAWARNLPTLLGAHAVHRTVSSGSTQGHRISLSMPISHRPQSRNPSGITTAARTPAMAPRSLSRAPSLEPAFEREELSTVIDQDNEDEVDENENENDGDVEVEGMMSRSTSTNKRRKRGARKGKGTVAVGPTTPQDSTLDTLLVASQSLAREISMASKSSSHRSRSQSVHRPFEPVAMYALPTQLYTSPLPPTPVPVAAAAPLPTPVTKKPSKWKLSFGKNSASALANAAVAAGRVSPVEEVSPPTSLDLSHSKAATTASNVTSLIMGLNAPPATSTSFNNTPIGAAHMHAADTDAFDASSTWSRGRRGARDSPASPGAAHRAPSRSPGYALSSAHHSTHSLHSQYQQHQNQHQQPSPPFLHPSQQQHLAPSGTGEHWAGAYTRSDRAVSPNSTRSGRPMASSASSMVSSNWRSSMSTTSSAGTSTSAFTRYSNSSARSVSTTATSVSSASWRTSVKPSSTFSGHTGYTQGNIPKNIKIMDGVPWELDQLPRGQHPNPVGDIFGSPPVRKQRTRKPPKDLKLDTINERPTASSPLAHSIVTHQQQQKVPEYQRRDAATSTTDLGGLARHEDDDGVKKVQKGQINALAKMLSALRR